MMLLTNEQQESYKNAKFYYICQIKNLKINIYKVRDKIRDDCR